ncbi:MAG: PQQ-dependent sugar dehydrogenase [Gammaproteobacteria bacterium]|nr:PQQ-dependent sugar dehydrogenase [Gammaproteobacteria bacterium]
MKRIWLGLLLILFASPVVAANYPVYLKRVFHHLKFERPVGLLQQQDDNRIWYGLEQDGLVKRFYNNNLTVDNFIDLRKKVDRKGSETGLLGMAFHPQFSNNGKIYLSYNAVANGEVVSIVSQIKYDQAKDSVNLAAEKIILQVEQPYRNHNGGQIGFGSDGFLYIAFGDGGWAGDPQGHGQNKNTLLGALLRIDIDHGDPYQIPSDNPLVKDKSGRGEIYAWGLRNPWRWSFDKQTGELWLADVGQDHWEEVNIIKKGGNYGWNIMEGNHCYKSSRKCDPMDFEAPVWEYSHDLGQSITGGFVYRGDQLKFLQGQYIFGDFVSGRIWALGNKSGHYQVNSIAKRKVSVSTFAQDNQGELYAVDYMRGFIYKISPASE